MPLFRKSPKPQFVHSVNQELRISSAQGDKESVIDKLERGAKLVPDKDGRTALHIAATSGHSEVVGILVNQNCDLNGQDKLGYTALQRAAQEGQDEVVRILVDAGVQVNKRDFVQENTAMHEAARQGHLNVLQLLICGNADLYIRNKIGATALHVACQLGRTGAIRWFLQNGCKPDVKDKYDDTPLHTSVRYLHSGATKILLSSGAPVNEQNKNGDTPLHLSCNLGQKKLKKLLVQAGASCTLRNKQNETPRDIASRRQSSELNNILKSVPVHSGFFSCGQPSAQNTRKHWKRARKSKIRARLEEARQAGSNWHLLFQDWDPKENQRNGPERRETAVLRKGDQYFLDLAGNVQKGPTGNACHCAPFFWDLARQNTEAQQELLDEIDACHDELSHEINDLRQVTKRHLADMERGIQSERKAKWKASFRQRHDYDGKEPCLHFRGRLVRSRSESELETDIERGRLVDEPHGTDSMSNASDDIYLERYWKGSEAKRRSISSQDSQSRGSSKKARRKKSTMESIRETFQETLQQFNRLDLDDSCTTPTSGSSQPYTGTATSHSGTSQAPPPEPPSQRASLYSCRSGNSTGNQCQPPSLDSGYGTGMSPSPAVSRSEQNSIGGITFNSGLLPVLVEVSTQTDTSNSSSHEYTELESVRKEASGIRNSNRFRRPPKLHIPPPPRHPVPPVPTTRQLQTRQHSSVKQTSISTNV